MVASPSRSARLCPDIFNAIQTRPIPSVEMGSVGDGLPSYAKLDVIIAYLTAPTTLNYDTLSDFLMTYRLYASHQDVWYLMASRLLWAANTAARNGSESEAGRDVGTRSFVLIRMWIRDYFTTDFVPNFDLREAVAETITILSGCTEFVLVDHFYRILSQLRHEWDTQISRYWSLPSSLIGNVDTVVPVGGDPLDTSELIGFQNSIGQGLVGLAKRRKSPVLSGEIPIDAHYAVPSILSSPQRRKPKAKLSAFFKKRQDDDGPGEAVLHDKVDLLAMRIIDEYHRREYDPVYQSAYQSIFTSRVNSYVNPHNELRNPSNCVTEHQNQQQKHQPEAEAQPTGELSFRNLSTATLARTPSIGSLNDEEFSTPTPSIYQEDVWATPRRTPSQHWVFPQNSPGMGTSSRQLDDQSNDVLAHPALDFGGNPENLEENGEIERHADAKVKHNDDEGEMVEVEEADETERNEEENKDEELRADISDIPIETEIENNEVSADGDHNMNNDEEGDSCGEDENLGDGKETPTRDYSDNSLEMTSGGPIVHEQSVDTLNMHGLGLANTSADSEVDFILDDPTVPTAENWGNVNLDEFDQVSYSGSSLSTLSTSTRSGFSYHARNISDMSHRSRRFSDKSISLLSELDNSLLQPCAGYTQKDAARLKAIPDFHLGEDALTATLQKLEGIDAGVVVPGAVSLPPNRIPHSHGTVNARIPRSSTIELYNQALESTSDESNSNGASNTNNSSRYAHRTSQICDSLAKEVSQLGIASNTKPNQRTAQAELQYIVESEAGRGRVDGNSSGNQAKSGHEGSNHDTERWALDGVAYANNDAANGHHAGYAYDQHHDGNPADPMYQPDPPKMLPPTLQIGLPGATAHAPFILSYTARAVAEQMTYIERELASQIDIASLVRMNHTKTATRKVGSWLEVIMEDPPFQGINVVTARFDLVRRWVQSEILLCHTPALQAQSISRFVHIAFEALRLQNFATMVQLVLGLSSYEVQSQLGDEMYKLLPEHDRLTLERLERLASSSKNYSKLKRAHNRFSWSKGCVPFTTMFLGDIELTAEAASVNAEQEIHFGKYRVASQVVKSLQRCIQSSDNYTITPEPALLSKCLYLATLPGLK